MKTACHYNIIEKGGTICARQGNLSDIHGLLLTSAVPDGESIRQTGKANSIARYGERANDERGTRWEKHKVAEK